tara:strand:- start:570 stop:1772 length:1203 start_codon:yes stop_codon:yes gene_type:complete
MRPLQQIEEDRLNFLIGFPGVEVGLFEVTETQLKKSIIDANFSISESFEATAFHIYREQQLSSENKQVKEISLFTNDGIIQTSLSLYRPKTKFGDPRLWISKLPTLSPETKSGDVVAIAQNGIDAIAWNLTKRQISPSDREELDKRLEKEKTQDFNNVASELLQRITEISKEGPIFTTKRGDGAVGLAVEDALGIRMNNKQLPDYKGKIELKTARKLKGHKHITLFSKVPLWKEGKIQSYADLTRTYGYENKNGLLGLENNVESTPNGQGLFLRVNRGNNTLEEWWVNTHTSDEEKLFFWPIEVLAESLSKKHQETFWIEAHEQKESSGSKITLKKIIHTSTPRVSLLDRFFEDDTIYINHTGHFKENGKFRDHGMSFRTKPRNFTKIFKMEGEYDLSQA